MRKVLFITYMLYICVSNTNKQVMKATVKEIFNYVSGINAKTSEISSIGTYVSPISQQIAEDKRNAVISALPVETLAYKIATGNQDRLTEKQIWCIAYELLKNENFCTKLNEDLTELAQEIEYDRQRKSAKRQAKKDAKKAVEDYGHKYLHAEIVFLFFRIRYILLLYKLKKLW